MVEAERAERAGLGWKLSPFTLLGLSVDATARDIRRRLDEIEVEASLGSETEHLDRVSRLAAARSLEDPLTRLEAELTTPWSGSESYDSELADEHDFILREIQALPMDPTEALDILSRLAGFARSFAFQQTIMRRAASLTIDLRDGWEQEVVASQLMAPLAAQVASEAVEIRYLDLADIVERLGDSAARVVAGAVATTIQGLLADERGASTAATLRWISAVESFAAHLPDDLSDIARQLRGALVDYARAAAHHVAQRDDYSAAERILDALGRCDLPEADRILASEELSAVAQINEQRFMAERALAGSARISGAPPLWTLNGCGVSLAGGHDHDPASGLYSSTYYLKILWIPVLPLRRYRVRQAGDGLYQFVGRLPLRPQDWWHVVISVALIVVAVIALGANSEQTDTGGRSPSTYQRASNSTTSPPAGPSANTQGANTPATGDPGSSESFGSTINAARALAERRLGVALDAEADVPLDPDLFGFHSASARAESAFRDLDSALDTLQRRGGTLDPCERAIQSWASVAVFYWSGLASATQSSDLDVDLWNSTLDRYQATYYSTRERAVRLC